MSKIGDSIEVTREDQEKINLFSRLNQQLTDVDESVESRNKIVKDINDANEIIEELGITDEDAPGTATLLSKDIDTIRRIIFVSEFFISGPFLFWNHFLFRNIFAHISQYALVHRNYCSVTQKKYTSLKY